MSKLSYTLQKAVDELDEVQKKTNVIIRYFRICTYCLKDLWYNYPHMWISKVNSILRNLEFFLPHILHMRDFDYSYQLNLFCDSLEHLARGLKRYNNGVLSERNYKRCLFAARRLRNAYEDNSYKDRSYASLSKNNPIRFDPLDNGMIQMGHDFSPKGEEYYNKMFKLIHKRVNKVQEAEKKEAVAYLFKYIQHFWD